MTWRLLEPTGNTEGERLAHDADPRPGSWLGDGRMLTQAETDTLICTELWRDVPLAEVHDLTIRSVLGEPRFIIMCSPRPNGGNDWVDRARAQRGGLHSDPLLRLLTFRAWGARDQRWFEDRGIRAGDPLRWHPTEGGRAVVTLAWPSDGAVRRAQSEHTLRPGERYLRSTDQSVWTVGTRQRDPKSPPCTEDDYEDHVRADFPPRQCRR